MARNTQALSATTRENKIKRLQKHIKKMTKTKPVTRQVDGRLVTEDVTKCWDDNALAKLKALQSV